METVGQVLHHGPRQHAEFVNTVSNLVKVYYNSLLVVLRFRISGMVLSLIDLFSQ